MEQIHNPADVTVDQTKRELLFSFIRPAVEVSWCDDVAEAPIRRSTPGLEANRDYFDHEDWASS
jgi:hypothetical protein